MSDETKVALAFFICLFGIFAVFGVGMCRERVACIERTGNPRCESRPSAPVNARAPDAGKQPVLEHPVPGL